MRTELKAQGCTNLRLRQLTRRVSQLYDVEMAKAGLKTTQFSLLSHILKLGPLRPGELALKMKFTPSTQTRNLKPLIDAGWASLSAGSDARSRTIAITPAGEAKWHEALQYWKVAQDSLNQRLGAARVLDLHRLINESMELLASVKTGTEADDE